MPRKKEAGQALLIAAAALGIILMGFAGLGVDMGYLRYQKRLQQTAADSAAIAGAAELLYGGAGVAAAAEHDSAANGFTNGGTGCPGGVGCVTVTVNNPPASGPHSGAAGYVEVLVAQVQPTFFMRILGVNSETITARAVATDTANSSGCLYTLGTTASNTYGISVIGGATITANNCGVIDDAGLQVNNGGKITAASIGVAVPGTPPCSPPSCTPLPTTGIVPASDPLSYLTPPTPASPCITDPTIGNGVPTTTLSPGTYCSMTICGNNGGGSTVNFNSGVYIINGNFTVGNGCTLNGTSVMFYEVTGTISLGPMYGSANLNLTAPTTSNASTGASAGILVWQAASDTNPVTINNGSNATLTGALYFPTAALTLAGGSNTTPYTIVVAKSIASSNGASLTLNSNYSSLPGGSPIKDALLVE